MRRKIKLLLVVSTLADGGAERIFSYLTTHLSRDKFELSLCLIKDKISYEVPRDIIIYKLNKKRPRDFFSLFFKLRKLILRETPDIVFSTMFYPNILSLLAKIFLRRKVRLVIRETTNPYRYAKLKWGRVYVYLMKLLYPQADVILGPSRGIGDALRRMLDLPPGKLRCVFNFIDIDKAIRSSREEVHEDCFKDGLPIIISIGRLEEPKDFSCILSAFQRINTRVKSDLLILGEGSQRKELEALATRLGIRDRISFLGFQDNPFKYIARSNIFAFSSVLEGCSNVLIEAMTLGVPIVSTATLYGPKELVDDGVEGYLVPVGDADELADKILTLLRDEKLRQKLGKAGAEKARQRFSLERGIKEYETIFLELFNQG
jgi:glycosyltransferase involved in cell wall biosynthesis